MRVNRERLRSARQDANLSIEKLARKLGVSWITIWRAESGETSRPSANTIGAWATACGVPVESLYEESEDDSPAEVA